MIRHTAKVNPLTYSPIPPMLRRMDVELTPQAAMEIEALPNVIHARVRDVLTAAELARRQRGQAAARAIGRAVPRPHRRLSHSVSPVGPEIDR